jgi:hypothetical protein
MINTILFFLYPIMGMATLFIASGITAIIMTLIFRIFLRIFLKLLDNDLF